MSTSSHPISIGVVILFLTLAFQAPGGTLCPPPESPWSVALSLSLRESHDSNVFLQDVEPSLAGVTAARAAGLQPSQAGLSSFVSLITPKLEVSFKPSPVFNLSASYAPDIAFYHNADSEDYVAHRMTLNFGGTEGKAVWEFTNTAVYVDGNELGPVFARPGDIPAIGGIPLRDRREQFLLRNGFKVVVPTERGFIRPVASFYYHDFRTGQRASPVPALYAYENYIDRSEISAGVDLGYKVAGKTALVLGYRFGVEDQYNLLGVNSPYDSKFHRVLLGIEGTPNEWLKLAILAGPDFRDFRPGTPAGFDRNELLYYVDGVVTLTPNKVDTVTLLARRYEQPAFSSHSVYEDITYEANWKHRLNDRWATNLGFRAYGGDWQAPVQREDWIFTPSASLIFIQDASFSAELGYTYDWVDNQADAVPGTPAAYAEGREFTRSIVSVMGKYSF